MTYPHMGKNAYASGDAIQAQLDAEAPPASRNASFATGINEKAEVYAVKDMTDAQRTQAHDEHVASLGDEG